MNGVVLTDSEMRAFRDVARRMIKEMRGSGLVGHTHVGLLRVDLEPWGGDDRMCELRVAARPEDYEEGGS